MFVPSQLESLLKKVNLRVCERFFGRGSRPQRARCSSRCEVARHGSSWLEGLWASRYARTAKVLVGRAFFLRAENFFRSRTAFLACRDGQRPHSSHELPRSVDIGSIDAL